MLRPALIVHGGAGAGEPEMETAQVAGCNAAVWAGWELLRRGGSALDAVCAAVAVLEDDPTFNAGIGSHLTRAGTVEMDASVMEGRTLRVGAAALLRTTRHPIELARAILHDGRHVFFAGPEADALSRGYDLATCEPQELITARQQQRWERGQGEAAPGTVGAVAVDRDGHVAAATSTGGMANKLPGRIGDSAVIGAGTYAADGLGAASATGVGEAIIRVGLAKAVVDALREGADPAVVATWGVQRLERDTGATAGIILVDPFGRIGTARNTARMSVGYMRSDLDKPVVGV